MGVLLAIICLILDYLFTVYILKQVSIIILIISLIYPLIFLPVLYIWLKISQFLGYLVSLFILVLIFYMLITPVGFIRRIIGFDDLNIKGFKRKVNSGMLVINKIESQSGLTQQF